MATLTFTIRKSTGKSASIYLVFNYGKEKRLRYNTKLKVENSKNWDKGKMRVKNVMSEINKEIINSKLDDVQAKFNKRYTELLLNKDENINNDSLKDIADSLFDMNNKEKQEETKEFLPFFKWYLDYYSKNPVPSSGKPLNKGTLKTYKNTYTKFQQFNDEVYRLSYSKITLSFYEDFLSWLYQKKYSTNYIGTIIKILKTIMNSSLEKEYHSNLDFKKRGFKKPTEEVTNIYLTEKELNDIHKVDLNNFHLKITGSGIKITREKLETAKDLFLISAYTGLRVSDFNRLTSENFIIRNRKKYLEITTQKTGKPVAIPVHPVVQEIFDKRGGNPPKKMPEQHINYAIKIVGEIAKINETFTKSLTRAGKKESLKLKKHELISNHTGRRSFCTNAYLSGMPTIDIMAISGHSSERVFLNYIKADHLQKAEKIAQHPFFN